MNGFKNVETYSVREHYLDDIVAQVHEGDLKLPSDHEAFREMVFDIIMESTQAERDSFLQELVIEAVWVKPDWRELLDWTREAVANY